MLIIASYELVSYSYMFKKNYYVGGIIADYMATIMYLTWKYNLQEQLYILCLLFFSMEKAAYFRLRQELPITKL